jgi:hypothetical protein
MPDAREESSCCCVALSHHRNLTPTKSVSESSYRGVALSRNHNMTFTDKDRQTRGTATETLLAEAYYPVPTTSQFL